MIILYAIPIFTFTILTEWFFTQKHKVGTYSIKDACTSISMGIGYLILSFIFSSFLISIFSFFYQYKIFDIPSVWTPLFISHKFTLWAFLLLLIADDFAYYWFHRISHECRLFWCFHETHHSSEYYNFATALRQSWTDIFFGFVFWIPLAVLGFHVQDILIQISLNLFYQFWVHTRYTKSIKYFDYLFNTPSHHRVHHAKNIEYLDKNYGGIFIIWDRIFGTFKKEETEPDYGVLSPVKSHNPFYVGFHMCIKLIKDVFQEKNFRCKLKYIFYPPGWCASGKGKTTKELQDQF